MESLAITHFSFKNASSLAVLVGEIVRGGHGKQMEGSQGSESIFRGFYG